VGFFNRTSNEILQAEKELLKRADPMLDGVRPPSRSDDPSRIEVDQAQGMSIIFRGTQLHQTSAKQCSIYGVNEYDGTRIKKMELPAIVRRPVYKYSFREYISRTISSLLRYGNAYRVKQYDEQGKLVGLLPLNAGEVIIETAVGDPTEIASYNYRGRKYSPSQISHLKYVEIDEYPLGLAPFEAANIELKGIFDTRNYTRQFLKKNSIPLEGYLKSQYDLDNEEAKNLKDAWNTAMAGEEGIAVLPQATDFVPMFLKPSDLQWIDVQKFDAIQQCRLIAAPASVMLISLEGNSQTYANIEQDWIGYVRFGLMAFLLPIEDELSELAGVDGQTITVKFNTDALLRSDTLTRYQAHAIATGGRGWMLPDEVRTIEDRDNSPEIDQKLEGMSNATNAAATPQS